MKFLIPLLAVTCFAFAGCNSHPHAEGAKCCGKDGKCCKEAKACAADCTKPCCAKTDAKKAE